MERMEIASLAEAVAQRLFVPLEASGRHVHMTKEQAQALFGHPLTSKRPLSQPGQFLANERVTVVGPKGKFENVAVLGPERKSAQIEISLTDARSLGIHAPVRESGNVSGTSGATLIGSSGSITIDRGVLAAQRHIHLTPEDGKRFGVRDKQIVKLKTYTSRPTIFEDVLVRISPDYQAAVHLDYDEANACGFTEGDLGRIIP